MKIQASSIKAGMMFKYGKTPCIATSDAYTIAEGGKDVYIDMVDIPHTVKYRGAPALVSKGGNHNRACFRATTMVDVTIK